MKFCWCTLHVKNMDESVSFYKEVVGLKETRRFMAGPDTEIVFLGNGETEVELIWDKNKESSDLGEDISLGFMVESVEKQITLLKEKGLQILTEPISPNPNITFFFALDPNGLKIQFVEKM
ncbi:MAG TPA: VOC family protein [Clostridia bacterium]|jgi:lactoylglutathione lyase|nr:VOC family protein [Clostridiaceae bacterium]HOA30756.1 VOC family protein [Clostridia bacterium]HPZ51747.1 VOC family protein [Clostridia bacterium]